MKNCLRNRRDLKPVGIFKHWVMAEGTRMELMSDMQFCGCPDQVSSSSAEAEQWKSQMCMTLSPI